MQRPTVRQITPLLVVSDLSRSIDFYVKKLGFTEPATWGEPPCFAMFHRDEFDLMLSLAEGAAQPHPNGPHGILDVYIKVTDARAEAEALRAAGITLERGPSETEYGMVEIEIVDPDGYRICFGSDL